MEAEKITGSDMLKLQKIFASGDLELSDAINKCMEIISDLTNYTSVVLGKNSKDNNLLQVSIIAINPTQVVAVVCTDKGNVENKMFNIGDNININELIKTSEIINKMLAGTPIDEVSIRLENDVKPIIKRQIKQYETVYNIFYDAFNDFVVGSSSIHIAGRNNIFNQPEYNEDILKWLVKHGYDVGNHTYSHVDFTTTDGVTAQSEVGSVYAMLEEIIPDQYVHIVALPFGSPYTFDHPMIPYIQEGTYEDGSYKTEAMLQVAWEADYSPYNNQFNPAFIKRIRAYDNNGENFDIQMNFDALETNRYRSDGDPDTIVIPEEKEEVLGNTYEKKVITYSV